MKWKSSYLAFVAVFLFVTHNALAVKSVKLSISKGQSIVVKVPLNLWRTTSEVAWGSAIPISVLRVDSDFVKSKRWENGKLPLLATFHVEKAEDCGSGMMSGRVIGCPKNWRQVELRSDKAWLKIQFPPEISDIDSALQEMIYMGSISDFESSSYLHDKVFLPNEEKLFADLPKLGQDDRYEFFKIGVKKGFDISSTKFKGVGYLEVEIPAVTIFNTLKVSQDQRIAQIIREVILPESKSLLLRADGKPLEGLAFHLSIPAYNFATGGEEKYDDLRVYIAIDKLKKFAESDITSQKLIDDSFVLLNDDRIEAKL